MKLKKTVFTILGLVFVGLFSFMALMSFRVEPVVAQVKCPSNMDPNSMQCYQYLQEQATLIEKQKNKVQKELKDIEYQKLSLEEKITYTNNLIADIENSIKGLQIQIAAADIEINMFEKQIKEKEDNISLLRQEIEVLSSTVNERITESYKYSFVSQIDLLLDFENIGKILRKIKYLEMTRAQDKVVLGQHTEKTSNLIIEENQLSATKADLQAKREEVENERVELGEEKLSLDTQKAERQSLLAQAKAKEVRLAAELNALIKESNSVAEKVSALAMRLFNSGVIPANTPVKGGETILGYQGHTGYAYGSHLHFELWINGAKKDPIGLGYFNSGGVGSGLSRNKAWVPLGNGAILTQNYSEGHYAIDMIGGWNSGTYTLKKEIRCYGMKPIPAGYTGNLNGEGTPVKPIKDGKVTKVQVDDCGGKYVIVDHGNGEATMYLHLM